MQHVCLPSQCCHVYTSCLHHARVLSLSHLHMQGWTLTQYVELTSVALLSDGRPHFIWTTRCFTVMPTSSLTWIPTCQRDGYGTGTVRNPTPSSCCPLDTVRACVQVSNITCKLAAYFYSLKQKIMGAVHFKVCIHACLWHFLLLWTPHLEFAPTRP